jgi:hypothetical protein
LVTCRSSISLGFLTGAGLEFIISGTVGKNELLRFITLPIHNDYTGNFAEQGLYENGEEIKENPIGRARKNDGKNCYKCERTKENFFRV